MESTMELIEKELDRIQKTEWLSTISNLINNFSGYPIDEDNMPELAIYDILKTLDPHDSPEIRFINKMGYIDAFTYRAFYVDKNENAVYWNPLRERYEDFKKNAASIYQASMEYPAADIIHKWLFSQFKQSRS
jgi:hypothetical protein